MSAAVSGTAAIMLTLLAMLGGSGANTLLARMFFDSQLLVLELALIAGVSEIIRRRDSQRKMLSHISAVLLILGTVLVAYGAALPL